LLAAEELTPRDVAVAVAVHRAEPERAILWLWHRRRDDLYRDVRTASKGAETAEANAAGRPAPHQQLVGGRHIALGEVALGVLVEPFEQFRRLTHLVDAQPAVMIGVEQVEQAAAFIYEDQCNATG